MEGSLETTSPNALFYILSSNDFNGTKEVIGAEKAIMHILKKIYTH